MLVHTSTVARSGLDRQRNLDVGSLLPVLWFHFLLVDLQRIRLVVFADVVGLARQNAFEDCKHVLAAGGDDCLVGPDEVR